MAEPFTPEQALEAARIGFPNDYASPGDPALLDVSTMCDNLTKLSGDAVAGPAQALDANPNPALATRLGYIVTGDAQVDGVSKAGLEGLAEYVNRRTAAVLAEPDAVEPGKTDLSFYPLLYWPITADLAPLNEVQAAARKAWHY